MLIIDYFTNFVDFLLLFYFNAQSLKCLLNLLFPDIAKFHFKSLSFLNKLTFSNFKFKYYSISLYFIINLLCCKYQYFGFI